MRSLAAAAVGLALALGAAMLTAPRGFTATYYANDTFTPPHERGIEQPSADATRIDSVLAFHGPGRPDWPLYFFNDHTRFNFYQPSEPRRAELGFSVVWDGALLVEEGRRDQPTYLRASAAEAELWIDGALVLHLPAGGGEAVGPVFLAKGWRQVRIRARVPYGGARDFDAGTIDAATGVRRAFGPNVFPRETSAARRQVDAAARLVRAGAGVAALGVALWIAWRWARRRGRQAVALAWGLAVADAWLHARPWIGRLVLLPGGDDSLTYETQARDILINGPLMLLGHPYGQAEAFYYQPLYGYVLAAIHGIFGPGMFGVYFVQRLLIFVTLMCVWRITARLFGGLAGQVSLVVGGLFLYTRPEWEMALWGENVFVPLVAVWMLQVMAIGRPAPGARTAVLAGLAGGLAVLSRSTLLAAVPPVTLVALWAGRARRRAWVRVAVMLVVLTAVVSVATMRNWIAAGTFVPITTSFSINLYLGNTPPEGVPVHDTAAHAFYEWFAAEDTTRMAVEFARHAPGAFAAHLGRKLLYSLGVFEPLVPGAGYSATLMILFGLAVAGVVLAARGPAAEAGPARWLPLAVAASLIASVTIIFPSQARLVLPSYVPLLPYVALAGARLVQAVSRRPH